VGRWWRILPTSLAAAAVLAAAVLGIATNRATADDAILPGMRDHPIGWMLGATAVAVVIAVLSLTAQRRYERGLAERIPAAQRPEPWMVVRSGELALIRRALLRSRSATVGITTAVHGAGGFGKTTVARLIASDRRVLRHFRGRVYWVTLGRDARGGTLVGKINDLLLRLDPERAQPFTDFRQAGDHLAAILAAGPRRLIILDDVWFADQLDAFPVAGRCARLMTTRISSLTVGEALPVKVDEMSPEQARGVLTAGLSGPLPSAVLVGLLAETGRWPLLLRLLNKILLDQSRSRTDVGPAGHSLLAQLRRGGPIRVDRLTGAGDLDVNDPAQRAYAIAATIEASTASLSGPDSERFAELAVFAEDEVVPVSLVLTLWQVGGGMTAMDARGLCARLDDLALLSLSATEDGGTIALHDVIRDYLREQLGEARLVELHGLLLDAVSSDLDSWWRLPQTSSYLREHLVEHLLLAGRSGEAEELATDMRWVLTRLEDAGPLGALADLARVDTSRGRRLQRVFAQAAYLLTPTDPAHSLLAVVRSRFGQDPDWGPQARELPLPRPALISGWPLPDPPSTTLRRTIAAHPAEVTALALAPDETWFVSAGEDGTVSVWDVGIDRPRITLGGHRGPVRAVAITADQTCVVTVDRDQVRTWDVVTARQLFAVRSHASLRDPVTLAPDGAWWAVARWRSVVVREPHAGGRVALRSSDRRVHRPRILGASRDGASLLGANRDGTIRVWEIATGRRRVLPGDFYHGNLSGLMLAGHLLVLTAARLGTVRDLRGDGKSRLLGGHWLTAVGLTPDGSRMATGGSHGSIDLWDPWTSRLRSTASGHRGRVTGLAMPADGSWLLSAGADGTVRMWDLIENEPVGQDEQIDRVNHLAIAPDGRRLLIGYSGGDVLGGVRIRAAADGRDLSGLLFKNWPNRPSGPAILSPDGASVLAVDGARIVQVRVADPSRFVRAFGSRTGLDIDAVAVSPDGAFLAYGNATPWIRILDFRTGGFVASLDPGERGWRNPRRSLSKAWFGVIGLAIARDSSWMASLYSGGGVAIWDLRTARMRAELADRHRRLSAFAINPGGTWLVGAGEDGALHFFNNRTGRRRVVPTGEPGLITAMAVAPDGKLIATVNRDGTIRVRDLGARSIAMMRVEANCTSCAWSPDGLSLFVGGSRGLHRFDLNGFRPEPSAPVPTTAVAVRGFPPAASN
jgi:WD40 repeat protein